MDQAELWLVLRILQILKENKVSLINNLTSPVQEPTAEQQAAQRLIEMTKFTYEDMVRTFNEGSKLFWDNNDGISASGINAELGANASGIFYMHARLGDTIALIDPSAIADGLSVVGSFTQNEDGTITLG